MLTHLFNFQDQHRCIAPDEQLVQWDIATPNVGGLSGPQWMGDADWRPGWGPGNSRPTSHAGVEVQTSRAPYSLWYGGLAVLVESRPFCFFMLYFIGLIILSSFKHPNYMLLPLSMLHPFPVLGLASILTLSSLILPCLTLSAFFNHRKGERI